MGDEFEVAKQRILDLHWERKKKALAISVLSDEAVRKLRGLDDEMFEDTLEALLPTGS